MSSEESNVFKLPYPALTPAQRYHLEIFGCVIIKNTLTENENEGLFESLQKLKRKFLATDDPTDASIRGCWFTAHSAGFHSSLCCGSIVLLLGRILPKAYCCY